MKRIINGFFMCQSMFCALPCPCKVWDEDARDVMLQWLPAVGIELGLLWYLLGWACRYLGLSWWVCGLALGVFPYMATGYIHLDGFMDVTDAVKSCRSLERRREILKDSHVGSFAVIGVCLLLAAQLVFCRELAQMADLRILIWIPGVSRCCSILAVLRLPKMNTSQYTRVTGAAAWIPAVVLLFLLVSGFLICGRTAIALVGMCAGYGIALRRAYRSLEGMNGDVSGYSQTISELTAVAIVALL